MNNELQRGSDVRLQMEGIRLAHLPKMPHQTVLWCGVTTSTFERRQ
jgi:hypothetical protein